MIERGRWLRSGQFDVVPGVRALRHIGVWPGIVAVFVAVGAVVFAVWA